MAWEECEKRKLQEKIEDGEVRRSSPGISVSMGECGVRCVWYVCLFVCVKGGPLCSAAMSYRTGFAINLA